MNKKSRLLYLNEFGMSMVETVIALGLLAAGGTALLSLDKLNFEQFGMSAGSARVLEIVKNAHWSLQNVKACTNTLKDYVPGSGTSISGIQDEFGTLYNEKGKTYDGVKVVDIKVDAANLARQTYAPPGQPGLVEIHFTFQNLKDKRNINIDRRFKVWILTDAAGKIQKCQTPMLLSTSLWQSSPSNPDDIYYAAGDVGVNMANPNVELLVDGRVQFTTDDGKKGIVGKGVTSRRIELAENRPFGVVQNDGSRADIFLNDLLMGNLALLKGYPSGVLTCTPALEGSLRYNSSTNQFQYCGGDKWRSVVNGP